MLDILTSDAYILHMRVYELKTVFECITILLCLSLFYLYSKNRNLKVFLHAGLFFLCSSFYLLGESHLELALSPIKTVFWSKVSFLGVIGFAYTVPLIISSITERKINPRIKRWLGVITVIALLFVIFSDMIVRSDVEIRSGLLRSKLSPSYPFFIGTLMIIGLVSLCHAYRTIPKNELLKPKYLYVNIGFIVGISTGLVDIIGIFQGKPVITGINEISVIGIFIISLLFYWSLISQYSVTLHNLEKTEIQIDHLLERSERTLLEFVNLIAKTLEAKDHYTAGHSLRVREYAVDIAQALNLPQAEIELLKQACLLHDIGKIAIPDGVLHKKSPLSRRERMYIEDHPRIAKEILGTVTDFQDLLQIIYNHHERIDGKGYPNGIKKDDIPLLARIIAVADTYDAIRSERPYRKAKSLKEAIRELNKVKGKQLDEKIVNQFVNIITQQPLMRSKGGG